MTNETLFVLTPTGGLSRWDLSKTDLNLTQSITDQFCTGVVRQLADAFPMSLIEPSHKDLPSTVGICTMQKNYSVASMPIISIPLAAPFAVEGDQMYPEFDRPHPISKLEWVIPRDCMGLVLAITLDYNYCCTEQLLVARDANGRHFRLPLSNLYADCKLCSGRYSDQVGAANVFEACKAAWAQFKNSNWNADLYTDATPERRSATRKLFSYTVREHGIEQNPVGMDWTTLCEKVATEHITNYLIF